MNSDNIFREKKRKQKISSGDIFLCSITYVDPKIVIEPFPNPKNSPLGPQKVKNHPKIKSKSKVRIERNIEKELAQVHE